MSSLPPREFVRAVRDYGQEHELLRRGDRILVGVSGGPDSVALLQALVELAGPMRLALAVVHLDHALRAGSRRDASLVASLVEVYRLPLFVARVEVGRLAKARGWSI